MKERKTRGNESDRRKQRERTRNTETTNKQPKRQNVAKHKYRKPERQKGGKKINTGGQKNEKIMKKQKRKGRKRGGELEEVTQSYKQR